MITELFLIRHAQTEYNRQKRYCGFSDVPLNNTGIEQAQFYKNKARGLNLDVLFCSPLKRTKQTADILFSRKKVILEPRLKELNFGKWEGLKYKEIMERYGAAYSKWISDPFNLRPPQGESLLDLQVRCMCFLEFVLKKFKHKKIGIVSHAGPIRIMLIGINKVKKEDFWGIPVDHLSIHRIKFNHEA
ncbi:MAG: alpha-ribazole phosphatase [Candidatus Omnitrophica bacterium]|nr:alpha-ribazole phosphatase [Candidatus Omnitrophota bacterium]